MLARWRAGRRVVIYQARPTRLVSYLCAVLLILFGAGLALLTLSESRRNISLADEWTSTWEAVLAVVFGAAFLVAMERYTCVRVTDEGVEVVSGIVWRYHVAWPEVARFETREVMTRWVFVAVLHEGDEPFWLKPLDVAWVEQHLSPGWRQYQADALEVLNEILAESGSHGPNPTA
jgi:hypothetical protein